MNTPNTPKTAVRVICEDGTTWTTTINGTPETARAYYLGARFTEEDLETGRETVLRVARVDILSTSSAA